jgi:hypothetical protein
VRSRLLVILLALGLASGSAPVPAPSLPSELKAGISLVKEGDFEGAVVKLDAVVRDLGPAGSDAELAQAYLFLGVAYLELDQEALARGKFAQALARAPEMRLDPSEFSPQVIRTFEGTRQEALPAAPPAEATAAAAAPPAGAASEGDGRRSTVPLWVLGGAAVAGGVALASGGGSPAASPTPAPTPSPTPSPQPSASPTSPPTPPPTTCSYQARPRTRGEVDDDGAVGLVCNITAVPSSCTWNAVSTNPNWLVITAGANGSGSDIVRFNVRPNNTGNERTARIELRQDANAFCRIDQDDSGGSGPGLALAPLRWSSELQVPGGAGRVVVAGAHGPAGAGRSDGARLLPRGIHRVEAVLGAGESRPGVWRFRLAGSFRPGSLRVRAGEAAGVAADTIVFRLRGTPGERVAFELEVR